jgi:CDP-4-dehydro-6-deoxyglucose reductase
MSKPPATQYLSLSRAARLVGVKRGTLQKRIQNGDILTFEGELSIEELLKAYPQTELEDNAMIEHTRFLKDNAVNKILHDEPILPSIDILTTRVKQLSVKLSRSNALLDKYTKLADELKSKLDNLQPNKNEIKQLKNWLNNFLETPVTFEEDAEQLLAQDTLLSLMTAHVRVMPSGHDFFSEGVSSILEAGLRAGLSLNYGCSNGKCGKCLAKLVSGDVRITEHHDYIISADKKAADYMLMCCNTALTDIVIEAPEAHTASEIPQQQMTAKVKKINLTNDDVALVHLKTPRTNRLRFLAGQYVGLGTKNIQETNYSISSCPCDDMNLHFQIPKITGNEFSDHVFNTLKNGDSIDIKGPYGKFTLDEDSPRSLVFITWHTGFAPIRSLVEHAMALDVAETIHLVWVTPEKKDRYLDNLCRSWTDALDNFYYMPVNANMTEADTTSNQSIISQTTIELDDLGDYDFYVAGNKPLLEAARNVLINNGLPDQQFFSDLIEHV